MNIKPIIH